MSENNDNTTNTIPKTIKFNVGGKHFEVARDLIIKEDTVNETMLSRLVSDTWLEDPESEVFIDRDGDRFVYILDYLRYGELKLPINISFDLFMKDVDYFGIHVVQGSVTKEHSYLSYDFVSLNNAEKEKKHMLLAMDIVKEFAESSRTFISSSNATNYTICGKNVCQASYDEKLLNNCLAKFGFKVTGWGTYNNCGLRVLD